MRRVGIDIARFPGSHSFEGHLCTLLRANQISVVIDVGAHIGQFALKVRHEARYRGRIESFEPTPSTFEELMGRASSDPLWRVHNIALGSEDRVEDLRLFERSDWNSLREPDEEHLRSAGWAQEIVGTTAVQVRRLDALWSELVRPGDLALLKSDTQGYDQEVLQGAGDCLASIEVIIVEGSITTFYEGEQPLGELLERMEGLGYVPSGFFPVTRRARSFALDTVDVCFVRTETEPSI